LELKILENNELELLANCSGSAELKISSGHTMQAIVQGELERKAIVCEIMLV
jgi:hypothetical protein